MKSAIGRLGWGRRGCGTVASLGFLLIIHMGSSAAARALQVLEASDHAELVAEISDSAVNRIALDGDRISRVIQSPGSFRVEHDPVRGDLYLYPDAISMSGLEPDYFPAPARAAAPETLYLGTEQGFTYRLSLSAVSRDSAQILIRNPAAASAPVDRTAAADNDRRGELVSLILAVARRHPLPGYVVAPAGVPDMGSERDSVVELWRGSRFTARVSRTRSGRVEDARQFASLSGGRVVAAWLSSPVGGANGERIAVLVEENVWVEAVR